MSSVCFALSVSPLVQYFSFPLFRYPDYRMAYDESSVVTYLTLLETPEEFFFFNYPPFLFHVVGRSAKGTYQNKTVCEGGCVILLKECFFTAIPKDLLQKISKPCIVSCVDFSFKIVFSDRHKCGFIGVAFQMFCIAIGFQMFVISVSFIVPLYIIIALSSLAILTTTSHGL